jgi:hypothetical protein
MAAVACSGTRDSAPQLKPTTPSTAAATSPAPPDPLTLVLRSGDVADATADRAPLRIPSPRFVPCGERSSVPLPEARAAAVSFSVAGHNVGETAYTFPDAATAHARAEALIRGRKACPEFPQQVTVGGKPRPDVTMRRQPYPGLHYGDESYVYLQSGHVPGIGDQRFVVVVARVGATVLELTVSTGERRDDATVDAVARAAVTRVGDQGR